MIAKPGLLINSFDSVSHKECAFFFGVSDRTILRRLDKNVYLHLMVKT